MSKTSIVILTSMISRNSGGMSTALDLAESLFDLGYDLSIGLTGSSPLLYRIKDQTRTPTKIPLGRIYAMPEYISCYLKDNQNNIYGIAKGKSLIYKRSLFYELLGRTLANIINKISGHNSKSKFISVLENADIIIIASGFYSGAKEIIKKHTKAKIVYNHAGSPETFEKWWLDIKNKPIKYNNSKSLYVNYMSQFDKILFQAKDQAMECESKHDSLKNKSLVVKPSCAESKVLASKQQSSPYDANFNLVNVGSIQPRKGQHYTIIAFSRIAKKLPNTKIHFVGRITNLIYKKKIDNLILKHKLYDHVIFHNYRPDYLRFIAHADIVLQTSEAEGVSRVLREAMLLNKAILSFNISGTTDILENRKEAILTEPFDTEIFSNNMEILIRDKRLRKEIGYNALLKYYFNHSKATYYNSLINTINIICNANE